MERRHQADLKRIQELEELCNGLRTQVESANDGQGDRTSATAAAEDVEIVGQTPRQGGGTAEERISESRRTEKRPERVLAPQRGGRGSRQTGNSSVRGRDSSVSSRAPKRTEMGLTGVSAQRRPTVASDKTTNGDRPVMSTLDNNARVSRVLPALDKCAQSPQKDAAGPSSLLRKTVRSSATDSDTAGDVIDLMSDLSDEEDQEEEVSTPKSEKEGDTAADEHKSKSKKVGDFYVEKSTPAARNKRAADADSPNGAALPPREPKRPRQSSPRPTRHVATSSPNSPRPPVPEYTMDVSNIAEFKFQRALLHLTYKGNPQAMINKLSDGQMVLAVQPTMNPFVPARPGAGGMLWSNRPQIMEHQQWKVVVKCEKATPQTWEYRGDYRVSRGEAVSPEVFMSQPLSVRNEWGKTIAHSTTPGKCYTTMRIRIADRKKQENNGEDVTIGEAIHAIRSGEEYIANSCYGQELGTINLEFVGYDVPFVEKIRKRAEASIA
ncbi:hypothetical protein PUNSTDRAFT_124814 [Punctularia strigosozonata HHB-11173 SS5]|uniref:uncharacterized protein n=1 Tax=Punctularia strigosozonata (strain HHB-11173) TaxID=741275 RepID=UPI000441776C|nr:uncharacterized protein PUNSTDRAFT_124814 [Punctularia strigosozonata HHB-11173 SS5]EIN11474.1 hypothetical protein PUNSTDRAFT_124814 [Punctularia strigosozonata HHB-11173 SS5]